MTNPATASTAAASVAAANQDGASEHLQGVDIAKVLRSKGPVVSAVVLRCSSISDDDKPSAQDGDDLLPDLVEEVKIDTTPKKSEVEQLLRGPFTFVGQYEEEGIVLMARRGHVFATDTDETMPTELPRNPHKLHPPFADTRIYGDVVCMKVAIVEDPLDDPANASTKPPALKVASNDDFFLDYTKEDYLKFAARTDVVAPVPPEHSEEDENEMVACDDDGEDAGEWSGQDEDDDGDDEEPSKEEAQGFMMQLVLGTVLKQFQEQNGCEPDEQELAILKLSVAHKLGAMMGTINEGDVEEDEEEATVQDVSSVSVSTAVASPASSMESSPGADMEHNKEKSAFKAVGGEPVAKKLKVDPPAGNDKV
jgi:hypothetical protein